MPTWVVGLVQAGPRTNPASASGPASPVSRYLFGGSLYLGTYLMNLSMHSDVHNWISFLFPQVPESQPNPLIEVVRAAAAADVCRLLSTNRENGGLHVRPAQYYSTNRYAAINS
jgi:hypothetical protein